jgi:hypothetical protein
MKTLQQGDEGFVEIQGRKVENSRGGSEAKIAVSATTTCPETDIGKDDE